MRAIRIVPGVTLALLVLGVAPAPAGAAGGGGYPQRQANPYEPSGDDRRCEGQRYVVKAIRRSNGGTYVTVTSSCHLGGSRIAIRRADRNRVVKSVTVKSVKQKSVSVRVPGGSKRYRVTISLRDKVRFRKTVTVR